MIVTVTANPSIDRTLEIPALLRGEVVRATTARVHAGGKGVNVARALVANGVPARAVVPLGGREGEQLRDLLAQLGVEVVPVPIARSVRENVTVVEPDGTVTKLNAPGPELSPEEVGHLVRATTAAAAGAEWVALCGALPPGAPEDLYARLVAPLRASGALVAIDTSGPALARAVEAGPDLIKPNAEELAEVVGRPIDTLADVVAGAGILRERGVGRILVSLGRDGAVLVAEGLALRCWTDPVQQRSNVGAGDAALAGFLAASGAAADALRAAVAWGAAAVCQPGTGMPGPADIHVDRVHLEELDPSTAVKGKGIA